MRVFLFEHSSTNVEGLQGPDFSAPRALSARMRCTNDEGEQGRCLLWWEQCWIKGPRVSTLSDKDRCSLFFFFLPLCRRTRFEE